MDLFINNLEELNFLISQINLINDKILNHMFFDINNNSNTIKYKQVIQELLIINDLDKSVYYKDIKINNINSILLYNDNFNIKFFNNIISYFYYNYENNKINISINILKIFLKHFEKIDNYININDKDNFINCIKYINNNYICIEITFLKNEYKKIFDYEIINIENMNKNEINTKNEKIKNVLLNIKKNEIILKKYNENINLKVKIITEFNV